MQPRALLILDTFSDKDFYKLFKYADYIDLQKKKEPVYKLLEFIKKHRLSDEEFLKQIQEQILNENKIVASLNVLKKINHKAELKRFRPSLNTNSISNALRGGKKNSTLTDLANLLEFLNEFLAIERFGSDGHLYETTLIEEYHVRGMKKIVNEKSQELLLKLKKFENYHQHDFFTWFVIENLKYENEHLSKDENKVKEIPPKIYHLANQNNLILLHYYCMCCSTVVGLITYYFDSRNPEDFKNHPIYRLYVNLRKFVNTFISEMSINVYHKSMIRIYELQIDLKLAVRNKKRFFKLFDEYENILKEILPYIHIDEKFNVFNVYETLFPIGKGNKKFHTKELEFYKLYLDNKAFQHTGNIYIPYRTLWYFIMRGDSIDKNWTEKVLEDNLIFLEPENNNRLLIKLMRNLKNNLEDGLYDESLNILNFLHNFFKREEIDIRITRDKFFFFSLNYFELYKINRIEKYYSGIFSNLKSLEDLLKSENRPDMSHEAFFNFLKLFKKLVHILEKPNEKKISKLFIEVKNCSELPAKLWLKRKIDEISKQYRNNSTQKDKNNLKSPSRKGL